MRKYKERAVKYFAVFLLFMLICTIVSRGIYAWQMPKVVTGTMEAHALSRDIKADGVVITKEEVPVVVDAGILVEKVCVVEGQKVEAGDLLFQLQMSDLEKLLQQMDAQIHAKEEQLAQLNASGAAAVNRANQDLKDVSDSASGAVGQADSAYRAACAQRDAFPSEEQYRENAYQKDAEYQKLYQAAHKKKAAKADKEAFEFYKKSLDAALAENYAKEKQELDAVVAEKEQALNEANSNRQNAVKQAQRDLEDAKNNGGSGTKLEQQNEIQILKEQRSGFAALYQAEGKVLCGISGYVSRISVHAGERTADTSAMVISDAAGEKLLQAILPQEEKAYISAGDKVSISFQEGSKQISGVEIEAVGELEDGSCQVTCKISGQDIDIGELGKMELIKEIGRYACTIPKDALFNDGGTDYVFVIEEQETILGTELMARRRKVKIMNQDEEYAALEDDSLTDEEQFVSDTDKEIKDGTRVRLREE